MPSMQEEEQVRGNWVPNNVLQGKRLFGFRIRNVVEAGIWVALIYKLVSLVPFVTRVRWIVIVCLCLVAILVNLMGVKDMTISEVAINFVHCKMTGKIYHLRSVDHAKKEKRNNNGQVAAQINESAAERIVRSVKEKWAELTTDDEEDGAYPPEDAEDTEG